MDDTIEEFCDAVKDNTKLDGEDNSTDIMDGEDNSTDINSGANTTLNISSDKSIIEPSFSNNSNTDTSQTDSIRKTDNQSINNDQEAAESSVSIYSDIDNNISSDNVNTFNEEHENYSDQSCIISSKIEQCDVSEANLNSCEPENYDSSDTSALMKLAELACETNDTNTSDKLESCEILKSNENSLPCSENNVQIDNNSELNTINSENSDLNDCREKHNSTTDKSGHACNLISLSEDKLTANTLLTSTVEAKEKLAAINNEVDDENKTKKEECYSNINEADIRESGEENLTFDKLNATREIDEVTINSENSRQSMEENSVHDEPNVETEVEANINLKCTTESLKENFSVLGESTDKSVIDENFINSEKAKDSVESLEENFSVPGESNIISEIDKNLINSENAKESLDENFSNKDKLNAVSNGSKVNINSENPSDSLDENSFAPEKLYAVSKVYQGSINSENARISVEEKFFAKNKLNSVSDVDESNINSANTREFVDKFSACDKLNTVNEVDEVNINSENSRVSVEDNSSAPKEKNAVSKVIEANDAENTEESVEESSSSNDKHGASEKISCKSFSINVEKENIVKINSENNCLSSDQNLNAGKNSRVAEKMDLQIKAREIISQSSLQDQNIIKSSSEDITKNLDTIGEENSKKSEHNKAYNSFEKDNNDMNVKGAAQFKENVDNISNVNCQEHLGQSCEKGSSTTNLDNTNFDSDSILGTNDNIASQDRINTEIKSPQYIENFRETNQSCSIGMKKVGNEVGTLNRSNLEDNIIGESHDKFSTSPTEKVSNSNSLCLSRETETSRIDVKHSICSSKKLEAQELISESLKCPTEENEKTVQVKDQLKITARRTEETKSLSIKNLEEVNNDLVSQCNKTKDNDMVKDDAKSSLIEKKEPCKENSGSSIGPKIFIRKDLEEVPVSQNTNHSICLEGKIGGKDKEVKKSDLPVIPDSIKDGTERKIKGKRHFEDTNHSNTESSDDDEKLVIDEEQTNKNKKVKSSTKNITPVEVIDLVDCDTESNNQNGDESLEILESSKNFICQKCKSIWNDKVLNLLFEGNESVTINSRITYGAIICMNVYVSIHYPNIKEQALISLLDRADLAKNLGSIQVSILNKWLVELIKTKKINCCNPFRLVYKTKTSGQLSQPIFENSKQKTDSFQIKENLMQTVQTTKKNGTCLDNVTDSDNMESEDYFEHVKDSIKGIGETTSKILNAIPENKSVLTNGKILKQFIKSNPTSYNIVKKEKASLSPDLQPFYDQLIYESNLTEEEAKIGKRKYLTNKEVLNAHSIFILNAQEIQLDLYFKFLFQLLHYREHVLLIADGKSLVKLMESVRKEHNRQKYTSTKNKNFLNLSWDPDSLFSAPITKLIKKSDDKQPCVRDILSTFCIWKCHKYISIEENKPILRDELQNLYENKIQINDSLSMCVRLYSNYCRLLFDQGEIDIMKIKMFLNLLYLPKLYLSTVPNVLTFSPDMSFLPPAKGDISDALSYLDKQSDRSRVKRSYPDSFIDCKLQQTKKLKTEILSQIKSTKAASLMETYARLTNEMSYYEDKSYKDSTSEESQTNFRKSFTSYTPEVKLMAAKLRAANVDTEIIPIILENIFIKIFRKKIPTVN